MMAEKRIEINSYMCLFCRKGMEKESNLKKIQLFLFYFVCMLKFLLEMNEGKKKVEKLNTWISFLCMHERFSVQMERKENKIKIKTNWILFIVSFKKLFYFIF